jgi:hypothetical protein
MVIPACPPITVTSTSLGSKPRLLATNVLARQTSRVVTPKSFLGSYVPAFFRTSAAMGTVELTGLLIMAVFFFERDVYEGGRAKVRKIKFGQLDNIVPAEQ